MLINQIEECIDFMDAENLTFTAAHFLILPTTWFSTEVVSLMTVRSGVPDLTAKNMGQY